MNLLLIITLLASIQFVVFGGFVGAARGKGNVKAPAITGDVHFERTFRVHYNTMEQLIAFLPGLWAFGLLIDEHIAAALGLIYLVGRIVYFRQYIKDPALRGPGMLISAVPIYLLLLGGLGAAVWQTIASAT